MKLGFKIGFFHLLMAQQLQQYEFSSCTNWFFFGGGEGGGGVLLWPPILTCTGRVLDLSTDPRGTWGDLLRSVPFIMGGHLNMDFFQVVFAQVFDTNPKSICLMMIHKHSGRAPRPFQHLLLAMSALEMSGHDTKRLSWFFWSKSFQILCVKYINKTYYNAYFYFSDYCAASKSGKMGTVRPCQNHVWTSRN